MRPGILRRAGLIAVSAAALGLFATASLAKTEFEARGGYYADAEKPFAGVGALTPIGSQRWFFNPNFEFASDSSGDLLSANLDVHYDIDVTAPIYWWVGGGPAMVRNEPDIGRTDTDLGLDLITGIAPRNPGKVRPFVQGKVIVKDNSEAVLAVGLRF